MNLLLENKVALITGCDQGIGKSICKMFVSEGATVYANVYCEKSQEYLIAECADIKAGKVIPICFDVTNKDKIMDCIKRIKKEQNGKLDILINNAGIKKDGLVEMIDDVSITSMLDVNVMGVIHMTQAALKLIKRNPMGGGIVNISSIIGLQGDIGLSAYGATKGAIASFTKSLSKELISKNIRVNAVAPGSIDTDMFHTISEEEEKASIEAIGMKRLGRPEEVASVVLFLASDMASYMTGEIVGVDGGLFM